MCSNFYRIKEVTEAFVLLSDIETFCNNPEFHGYEYPWWCSKYKCVLWFFLTNNIFLIDRRNILVRKVLISFFLIKALFPYAHLFPCSANKTDISKKTTFPTNMKKQNNFSLINLWEV